MLEKWVRVRVVTKNGGRVLLDHCYQVCREDCEALRNDLQSLFYLHPGAQVELHEFWAPERKTQRFDSGNIFAIR